MLLLRARSVGPSLRNLAPSQVRLLASAPPSGNSDSTALTKKRGLDAIVKAGTGGRSSSAGYTATVFGSTGFVARYLVHRLGKQGVQTIVPYRGDELLARHLKVMGDLGQIVPLFYSIKDEDSIARSVSNSQVVINLVGRDYETKNFSFKETHVEGPRRLAKAAKQAGVARFIHVSALGASHNSPSAFLRSKAEGEEAVRQEFPDATIIRPSTIFGTEDRFLSRIAYLHLLPVFLGNPVVRDGQQIVQPTYVVDVAQGIINTIKETESIGKTYEFLGPRKYTYEQLVRYFGEVCHRPTTIVNYPQFVLKAFAGFMEYWPPNPMIAREDITRMALDEIHTGAPTLENLGIKPTNLESVILTIWRTYRPAHYLDEPALESPTVPPARS